MVGSGLGFLELGEVSIKLRVLLVKHYGELVTVLQSQGFHASSIVYIPGLSTCLYQF